MKNKAVINKLMNLRGLLCLLLNIFFIDFFKYFLRLLQIFSIDSFKYFLSLLLQQEVISAFITFIKCR